MSRDDSGPVAAKGLSGWRLALVGLLLFAPATIPYLVHALPRTDRTLPTGYIVYDMALYAGKGREHFDSGTFHPTYSNPCDWSYGEPRVYFQPLFLAIGAVREWTGLDIGLILVGAWILSGLLCTGVAIALYRRVVGLRTWSERLGLVVFFWGGGLLVAMGAFWFLGLKRTVPTARELFAFDPIDGWWFMSFGRNLIFPTEAFYHALFLGCVLAAIGRRFALSVALAALAAISSPFTGVELLSVLWTWCFVEVVFLRRPGLGVTTGYFAAITAVFGLMLGYYLGFLNLFESHRIVARQMSLDWGYNAVQFVPAYALVGALAAWRLRDGSRALAACANPETTLFLAWAAVAFALSNHEFAITARQPIHFTRGYVWIPLFFLGAPVLVGLFDHLGGRLRRPWGGLAAGLVLLLFLNDDLAWLARFPLRYDVPRANQDLRISPEQREVLGRVSGPEFRGHTLLSEDPTISYLCITSTPMRSWDAHPFETPDLASRHAEIVRLFAEGTPDDRWAGLPLVVVRERRPGAATDSWLAARHALPILSNDRFEVFQVPAP
ncbi:hypothetical protein EP7_002900 [Isosphaeraceae bacterium EP7]